jgi:hypothetical protein
MRSILHLTFATHQTLCYRPSGDVLRQVVFYGAPKHINVYVKIIVDHSIAHAAHFGPRQRRMGGNKLRLLFLNSVRSFADDLDITDDGSLGLMVAFSAAALSIP